MATEMKDSRTGGAGNDPSPTRADFEKAARFVLEVIDRNLPVFRDTYPAPASEGDVYPAIDNIEWTSSFWTGMLWLAYDLTGEAKYREAAEYQLASYRKRIEERIETQTHDLGFLYSLSAVAEYRRTGSETAKETALKAADLLAARYFPQAGIIQAWGDLNDPEQCGRMIIDCLLNLPLLYWASEVTGEPHYAEYARTHAAQAARYIVREDDTTYHTFYMDVETGAPKHGSTHQGYADDSCWSRGQAWGMYGFLLSYLYTGDESMISLSKRLTDYFLTRLPEDGVAYWDLVFTEGTEQERDSSASAIAVCAMLELTKHLPAADPDKRGYEDRALEILASLGRSFTTAELPHSNGVLKHAVYNKPRGMGIDECCIWGDYFYFEALVRVLKNWKPYW
ncbi:glycoside hydrolase family 88 protein [Paenibacillus caseinilyticus]|uniref:Glucuronyl hydrolase n=1 Tax=Paenibacillus mucilaginosus K02 TaxID=997761 RepID=I0BFI2_9BACL|nr:glycoside hydrolase family 88 protein [Paenibacillus mucilaginosus]AFH61129.1 glucuronyl hydrolase [Paenibacillus mucilaginosus K02]